MSIRRPSIALTVIVLCFVPASWHAQEADADPPRALAYSAPLLERAWQTAMDIDAAGRIYLAGYVCEPVLPVTSNAAQRAYAGGCDGFVAILGPDRRLQYATYLGGAQQERIWAIDVDAAGNVYVVGDTTSANFPTTPGAYDVTLASNTIDAFVTKISPAGALVYSTLLGGSEYELALGIAADPSGRAHVVGYTRSPDFPTTPGAVSTSYHGRDDAFYTRLDASGATVSYSTFLGGAGNEYALEIVLDGAGAAYVGGTTDYQMPTVMAVQPSSGGGNDGWLMKLGADGSLKYLTQFGGSGNDTLRTVMFQGSSVLLGGPTCSPNVPGAPTRPATCSATFVTKLAADGTAIQRTATIENLAGWEFGTDASQRVYIVGYPTTSTFPTTPDAFQSSPHAFGSPILAVLPFGGTAAPQVEYASYVGGGGPHPHTVMADGAGGVFIGLQFINDDGHSGMPIVNAPFASVPAGGAVMHFVPESHMVDDVAGEIVMYARDVTAAQGNWRLEEDSSAALGRKLRNPDTAAPKLNAPLATPGDYVEFQFHAEAGVNYHLWIRGRADGDHWANDSVFVQFSDSVDASGAPTARIGTTSGMSVNLEDCSNCGIKGWGWQDNGWGVGVLGPHIRFAATGLHTMRVQRREDGYAFDQIVLSSSRYLTSAPGPLKQASTVLAHSTGQPASEPASSEIVLHMTNAQTFGMWSKEARADAASGIVVRHPDAGAAKVVTMPVPAVNYFELSFDAEAGRAYRLWIRGIAERDYWGNDSVHVQFSDSVDASGAARWRIGSASSTEVNLEDCSGCGLRGWGWQDNGWGVGVSGPVIYFAATGRHVIRVTTREDGLRIDQIVLSPAQYLNSSPGALKSDSTILTATQ